MRSWRILVAIDASPLSLAAAAAGAMLARRLDGIVDGLYVEDINLARLAEHPHGTVVSYLHARRHANHRIIIAQALKLQLAQARRGFETTVPHSDARGGFHVRRGRVAAEMLEAIREVQADMLVLGSHGQTRNASRRRLGTTARAVLDACNRPIFLLRRPLGDRLGLAVLANDAPAASLAEALADGEPVTVVSDPSVLGHAAVLVTSQAAVVGKTAASIMLLPGGAAQPTRDGE